MKIILLVMVGLIALVLVLALVAFVAIGSSDGPKGPIPGGKLVKGELITESDLDWHEILGDEPVVEIELQLVNPEGSRTTGAFAYENNLYVPVDLGYIWRRAPDRFARSILRVIWFFKTWHKNAVTDGRVVVRFAGKRYELSAVKVTDAALLERFRELVSSAAEGYFGHFLPIETNSDDIWFFRLDARSSSLQLVTPESAK